MCPFYCLYICCSPGIIDYKTIMALLIWDGIVLDNDRAIPVSSESPEAQEIN